MRSDRFFDDPIARRLADVAHRDAYANAALAQWMHRYCSREETLMALVEALATERARLMREVCRCHEMHGAPAAVAFDDGERGEGAPAAAGEGGGE